MPKKTITGKQLDESLREKLGDKYAHAMADAQSSINFDISLHDLRESLGVTEKSLADKMNTDETQVRYWEEYAFAMPLNTLSAVVAKLGKTVKITFEDVKL